VSIRSTTLYVVWGAAYATRNVGDMAIARAIVRLLRRDDPHAEVTFVTSGCHDTHLSGYDGVAIVNLRRQPMRVLRLLRRSGLLLIAGGVPFGDSAAALIRFLTLVMAGRVVGAEARVVASSAADATLRPVNEVLCRTILSLTKSIAVRDQQSLKLLRRLKYAAVDFVPDLALGLDLKTEATASQFRPPGLADDEPYIVIAPRNFLADQHYLRAHFARSFDQAEAARLLASLAAVVEVLGRDRRIVFLPMNIEEGDHKVGLRLAECVAGSGRAPIVIKDWMSVESACALISRADLILAMRLHAVIFGVALGRPTVAQAYAGKVTGFMEWLRREEDALPLNSSAERLLESCVRRLSQGMPPHVLLALERGRRRIQDYFAELGSQPGRSLLVPWDPT
jgi:polysaccharide pyruvyl transferase WcaK-like protein